MKRIHNLVIGGIQSKIFNLILVTVIILSAVNIGISMYQNKVLSNLTNEAGQKQQETITTTTDAVMDEVVGQTLKRSNRTEAGFANKMFANAASRVEYLADYAQKLFANPGDHSPAPYAGPDPDIYGEWTAMVIYADEVDPQDPAIISRVGLLANMSEMMISFGPAYNCGAIYIALPEGAYLTASDMASDWFEDGEVRSYDPRTRIWYQEATEQGTLIFTDGERDALTGSYCIECAKPVYGPDGELAAVVGTDIYLDEIEEIMHEYVMEGEYQLLVNESGHAVLSPQEEPFPMTAADADGDLRNSALTVLSRVVGDALSGSNTQVLTGELQDGEYYITAAPIETTGWVLVSAYDKTITSQPAIMLEEQIQKVQEDVSADYQAGMKKIKMRASMIMLFVALLMLLCSLSLGKRIVKPLNTITRRIAGLREGNLEFKMEEAYRTGDEVQELAESFAALSHKTVKYVETVKQVTAEKERIGAELSLANQIQASMMPHIFPAFPERDDFDIYARMDPAKEVGGDFYDYFLIDNDHLCMVIADVSGKGVPAALFMMASKIILQSVAMLGNAPAEILRLTNQAICSNNDAEMFVTVWLGILELSTGKLTAANAGHEYPVLKNPDGKFALYKDKHGFVIGGLEDMSYREYEIQMNTGSKLFVYTDGVPEAANAQNELFGTERMIDALNIDPEASPEQILKNVRTAVDEFVNDAEQFDDLTMLCMEFSGDSKEQ